MEYFTFFQVIFELFGTKASPKRILTYCQLNINEVHTFQKTYNCKAIIVLSRKDRCLFRDRFEVM